MSKIIETDLKEIMEFSYTDYALEVIRERALPDVRDGMKPVHRRIIHGMNELGLLPEKGYRKSARIVGDVLGKYHPHGDTSVYDAMVKMAQEWYLRYPLVDGHGNFGSIDGDSAAAMRYTEVKQSQIFSEMVRDINKNTVDFVPNFDGEEKEPSVLPSRFPNLLVNGAFGIAVGLATKIPPHNLNEVIDGVIYQIDNENCSVADLVKFIKCPDFPTSGVIINPEDAVDIYDKGYGKFICRGVHHIEQIEGKDAIIITEIPYQVNKANLIDNIYNISKDIKTKDKEGKDKIIKAKIPEIEKITDESDRDGMRIVIELKKKNSIDKVLKLLYKHSDFQNEFNVNMTVLYEKELKEKISLKDIIKYYIEHQKSVILRRTIYDLSKTKERLHIVEGLKKALDDLDLTIKLIRSSKSKPEAKDKLMSNLNIDDLQANAILELRLQRLVNLEISLLIEEYEELQKKVIYLNSIIDNPEELLSVLKNELTEIKNKYGDKRRTQLLEKDNSIVIDVDFEEIIDEYNVRLYLTSQGYLKKVPATSLRGNSENKLKEGDTLLKSIDSTNKSDILLFSNLGIVYKLQCYSLDDKKLNSLGEYLPTYLNLENNESIIGIATTLDYKNNVVVIAYSNGKLAKIDISAYETKQNRSKLMNSLNMDSEVLSIIQIPNEVDLMCINNQNDVVVINTSNLGEPKKSRASQGNTLMKPKKSNLEFKMTMCELTNNIDGIEDFEEYRISNAGTGKFLKKADTINIIKAY